MSTSLPTRRPLSLAAAMIAAAALALAPSPVAANHTNEVALDAECPPGSTNHRCNGGSSDLFQCRLKSDISKIVCTDVAGQGTPEAPTKKVDFTPTKPVLSVPIPTLPQFSEVFVTTGKGGERTLDVPYLTEYIAAVYRYAVGIASVIAAVMLMIGGFKWLTAGGDAGRVMAAKENIQNALIGLALSFGAYTILYVINPDLVTFGRLKLLLIERQSFEYSLTSQSWDELLEDIEKKNFQETNLPSTAAPSAPAATSGPTPKATLVKGTLFFCNTPETCRTWCQSMGCVVDPTSWTTKCDMSKFPVEAPDQGMIGPNSPLLLPIPDMTYIRGNKVKSTQKVIDGLKKADEWLKARQSDPRYKDLYVKINNCHRDYRTDAIKECDIILKGWYLDDKFKNDPDPVKRKQNLEKAWGPGYLERDTNPKGWRKLGFLYPGACCGLAWPGANPHSSGAACDMALYQGDPSKGGIQKTSGDCVGQAKEQYRDWSKRFDEIMTNPQVGAKRLVFEQWHYEWGGTSACRAADPELAEKYFPKTCQSLCAPAK